MYNQLKNISETQGYIFTYARKDFQNLIQGVKDKSKLYLFLDPVQINTTFDDYGSVLNTTYSGTFMLLQKSDFGADYQDKYDSHIKPLIDSELSNITNTIGCSELKIQSWGTTEIINLFNQNMD